jgi:hypothetical protein
MTKILNTKSFLLEKLNIKPINVDSIKDIVNNTKNKGRIEDRIKTELFAYWESVSFNTEWTTLGDDEEAALEFLKMDGYSKIFEFEIENENIFGIYKKENEYYMIGLEEDPGWGSPWGAFIVNVSEFKREIETLKSVSRKQRRKTK